jgi:hypothetical protein
MPKGRKEMGMSREARIYAYVFETLMCLWILIAHAVIAVGIIGFMVSNGLDSFAWMILPVIGGTVLMAGPVLAIVRVVWRLQGYR